MKREMLKLKYPCSYLDEIDKAITIRFNRRYFLKIKEKILINLDVDNVIIPLEDIPTLYDQIPEC